MTYFSNPDIDEMKYNFEMRDRQDKINTEIYQRLAKLETFCEILELDTRFIDHPLRLKIWEENVIQRLEKLEALTKRGGESKPHKCPVCQGARYNKPELKKVDTAIKIDGVQCNAGETIYWKSTCSVCEGKGIIWA